MITLFPLYQENIIKTYLSKDSLSRSLLGIEPGQLTKLDLFSTNWFAIKEKNSDIGLCIVQPFTSNCIIFHVGIFQDYRHERMLERFNEGLIAIRNNYPDTVILTTVLKTNIPALKLILKADFSFKTIIKHGSKRGDILLFEAPHG